MGLKKKILSLSAAGVVLAAGNLSADIPTVEKTPALPRMEQKQLVLPSPFRLPADISPKEAASVTDLITRALKNPKTAQEAAELTPLVEHIMLIPRPFQYGMPATEMIWRTGANQKEYVGFIVRNQDDPQKTILSLQTTLAETAAHLKRHQEWRRTYQQARQTHLQLGQLVVNREALAKARHKDARLAGLSLLDGLSPGIELKHGNRLYRLRFEKLNDQTMTEDQIPILSFRTAAVQTPHQERPMTQKDLDTIKKPLIAAIRGGQAAGVLPETVQEVPLIGKALKFDFLLGSLINKVFDASLPYQAVFNTTSALRQTNMTDFKPVVFRGDAQIEQPDELVGFSFRVGSTTFKASIPYGCTVTQNGTKRTMNAAEAAFFKKTAMLHMTPEQHAQSTVFWNYFNTYVLPEPQKSVALLTQHKANVL